MSEDLVDWNFTYISTVKLTVRKMVRHRFKLSNWAMIVFGSIITPTNMKSVEACIHFILLTNDLLFTERPRPMSFYMIIFFNACFAATIFRVYVKNINRLSLFSSLYHVAFTIWNVQLRFSYVLCYGAPVYIRLAQMKLLFIAFILGMIIFLEHLSGFAKYHQQIEALRAEQTMLQNMPESHDENAPRVETVTTSSRAERLSIRRRRLS